MEIGEDFREELRSRIENCSAFLLFLSNEALLSKYCGMEIITAHKYDKRIYPVYLSDDVVIPAPLKMILENLQHVSGISKQNTDKYISKLIQSLPIETMRNLQTENDVLTHCKDGSTSIAVPSGIRVIGEGAFKNCDKLEDIDFGTEVEILNKEAFRGCKSLKEIRLAKNIRKVDESAFRDCINAKSLSVECGKIELGERAFENCASLSEIELCDDIGDCSAAAIRPLSYAKAGRRRRSIARPTISLIKKNRFFSKQKGDFPSPFYFDLSICAVA